MDSGIVVAGQNHHASSRPLVGWIGDSKDWTESEIDLCDVYEMRLSHHNFGLMREFLMSPRRCDVIVLDIGEIGRMSTTMPRVCDHTSSIILVSAITLQSTIELVEMLQDEYPDTEIRYAGQEPESLLQLHSAMGFG